jgi:hypothetical protein
VEKKWQGRGGGGRKMAIPIRFDKQKIIFEIAMHIFLYRRASPSINVVAFPELLMVLTLGILEGVSF